MLIEPNTNIKLLKNVPLDNTYRHTLYFPRTEAGKIAQTNTFMSYLKSPAHNLTNLTYQRVNRGVARVGLKAEDIYDCNYMMFQNTNFGNKWFYAFITSVEYINNTVSEIAFEIDVMQTWYFDYELKECFVEREHCVYDEVGSSLTEEPVDLGSIICSKVSNTGLFNNYVAVLAVANEED